MIGKLVKQKIFGEFWSDEEDGDVPCRYGIVLDAIEHFEVQGKPAQYYRVLWQPTPLFPVGGLGSPRPYTCLANEKSLIPAYEDEKS